MGSLVNKSDIMLILQHGGADVCEIKKYSKFDSTVGNDNTFQLVLPDIDYIGAVKGDIIDVAGTEFGGVIKKIAHSSGKVTITGTTWRGLLSQHVTPASIDTLSGDALSILRTIVTDWLGNSGLIKVADGECGTDLQSVKTKNKTILQIADEYFLTAGLRLAIQYDGSNAILSTEPISDLSNEIELSQDYTAQLFTSVSDLKFYNHCIAVGDGVQAEAWRLDDGTITTDKSKAPKGLKCVDILVESEKEDDIDKLKDKATEKLKDGKSITTLEMDISSHGTLELGDIVSAYDDITGISCTTTVSNIELKIEKGQIELNYEVTNNDSD